MNKFLLIFMFASTMFTTNVNGQGLLDIIVEKYHVSGDIEKKNPDSENFAQGTITYRVYVLMNKGYKLQSVYGSPGHELILSTSTFFYNNSINGSYIPNLIEDFKLPLGLTGLDSWIGMGAASTTCHAIPKKQDNESVFKKSFGEFQEGEISLYEKDGIKLFDGMPPRVTQLGMDSLLTNLDKNNTPGMGYQFITANGGWGCLGGASNPDSISNAICIAQLTTNGDLRFKFNIQIGSAEHGVEQYVSGNATGKEIYNDKLNIYISK